ncbi:hypothetical protein GCM10010869_49130 [Mesorhizobium tianshanense]|uniref:nuclear transport factor 2 family protein n=1 Tax=Mesorhizobium tianshanense TaxID=39844 RepID=UPI001F0AB0E1|nr:nuclear transport factor 2 family protein [Mesorhizobium tianshanense]GLS39316.1 hypothetical protein GCM10010869_49130 [Mesorhizobium tianshanense]
MLKKKGSTPWLDADDGRRLRRYVDLFNARDFDAVRALIAENIQLEVVNRLRGKAEVSTYFGNYDRANDWACRWASSTAGRRSSSATRRSRTAPRAASCWSNDGTSGSSRSATSATRPGA